MTLSASFESLSQWIAREARGDEILFANWRGELSDFVRFNHGRLRQAGTVERLGVELRLVVDSKPVAAQLTLSGSLPEDLERLGGALRALRDSIADANADPYLLYDTEPAVSARIESAVMPAPEQWVATLEQSVGDADLVGFYMGGPMASGLASSLGHAHYHESASWSFDYSIYAPRRDIRDKAIKSSLSGRDWDAAAVKASIATAVEQVPLLQAPVRKLGPGRYRALLSPRATADMLDMLSWGGFSARADLTGQSPLASFKRGEARFDSRLSISDDLTAGQVPLFQSDGFVRPGRIDLIHAGQRRDWLVSPRTAKEFGLVSNSANRGEAPEALHIDAGTMPASHAVANLDTGLMISNLWYLNFSDRQAARVTGMTRFATLWVENGKPVAPVEVMRFDDSLFELFGEQLVDLGSQAHWLPNTDSYDWRSPGGVSAPAALIAAMTFTL
jgi:predicted Zn-dependent protease